MTDLDNLPPHVPPHLARDYDFTDMQGETDTTRHFLKLRNGPDLFYTSRLGGHWVATRHADMEYIISNNEDFSSLHSSLPRNPFRLPLLESDEPIHADYRNLLAPFFTPKSIGNLEQKARDIAVKLIDELLPRGECDFPRDFGKKLPTIILMNLLGLPDSETPYLLGLSERMVFGGSQEAVGAAFQELATYIATKILPQRRANPGSDIFSALVKGTIEGGRRMTDEEIVTLGCLLIGAGLDTVASTMGFVAMFLAQHPAHRRQLIDQPERLPKALEEILRRHHIANICRVATRDLEINGVTIKAGDVIFTPLILAGLDERRYPDPMTVNFDRADTKHLGFGRGPHQCIGAFLARTELRVFITEWLKRIPDFEIEPGAMPIMKAGKTNALFHLPLVWQIAS